MIGMLGVLTGERGRAAPGTGDVHDAWRKGAMHGHPVWSRKKRATRVARGGMGRLLLLAFLPLLVFASLLALASDPLALLAQSTRHAIWDEITVVVQVRPDASFAVSERNAIRFVGGPFRQGFREIPLARVQRIDAIRVAELTADGRMDYTYVSPRTFSPARENTFTQETVGTNIRISWSFAPTTSKLRTFLLDYDVHAALRVYPDERPPAQQISWIGVGRELTTDADVNRANLLFVLPRPVGLDQVAIEGPGGDLPSAHTADGLVWYWRATGLGRVDSLEASLKFPSLILASAPSWQEASDRQEAAQAQGNLLLLGLAGLIAIGGGLTVLAAWWLRGRDPETGPVPELLTMPPADLPPGVAGALLDEFVEKREIVATLIDLGRRNVLRLERSRSRGSRQVDVVTVTLLEPYPPLARFEEALLAALFGASRRPLMQMTMPHGENAGFREAIDGVERLLYTELVERGYFRSRPSRTRAGWQLVGSALVLLAFTGVFITVSTPIDISRMAFLLIIVLWIGGFIVHFVARYMPGKTRAGAEAAAQWRGFKRYLEALEGYALGGEAQELFECYLPYAIAFGIEQKWVKAFSWRTTASPAWYRAFGHIHGSPEGNIGSLALPGVNVQQASDLAATSVQASSGDLFSLLNAAGQSISPAANTAGWAGGLRGGSSGLRVASIIFRAGSGSGGGGGGFS